MTPQIRSYDDDVIAAAAAIIGGGGIVAVPTETVYGLAADATNAAAVARIYAAKGRPAFNPLIVHVADLAAAERIAVFGDDARALAAAFWPGPLTLVLPVRAEAGVAALVIAGLDTIAVRVPRHRAMQALLAATGVPLAAPSSNASNGISPTRAAHVASSLGGRVPLIIDDGACAAGLESTIVAGRTILRPGPITAEQLTRAFPRGGGGPASTSELYPRLRGGTLIAPGQLASHYAPSKPLRLDAALANPDEYLIGFGVIEGDENLSRSADLAEAATRLFDALHRADAAPQPRIATAPIPHDGIGAAINDRLKRAATR
ncbi:L-threonylcarbamoyladenylate synthase [Sphingomonas oligophenolica]|uniref:Threonylcarbamoyl-AMP synthase n=1 Tax=Sphingomonas oligophenolica TaxID=301154 RepID=A0A502CGC6_9SPHN|nr:L-threonylcarbamoyladenylate synthase [Sphingomonas oligophenolica]TPG10826.1 threonylcarbamoyl-AMP synthase [Sphingomonas oligophenolica]